MKIKEPIIKLLTPQNIYTSFKKTNLLITYIFTIMKRILK